MPSASLLPPSLRALEHLRLASFLCFGGICTAQISSEDSTDGGRRLPRLPGEVPGRGAASSAPGFLHIPSSPPLCLAGPGLTGGAGAEFWAVPGQPGASPTRGAGLAEPRAPAGSPPPDSRDTCHICGRGALAPAFVPARRSLGCAAGREGCP